MSPQKITFGEMREEGYSGIIVYCRDHKCSHSEHMSADRWPDDLRITEVEPHFICTACARRAETSDRIQPPM